MDEKKDGFPEVLQKMLSDSDVIKLLDDIKSHAELHEIRIKQSGLAFSNDSKTQQLEMLAPMVLNRQIHSMQIRYTFDGELWLDTIMFREEQWFLVRMSADEEKATRA